MIIHTEGIVLKSFDFRETSRIVTFFTKEKGKMTGILKGIRKDSKKFGSSVDKFSVNDMVYYEYKKTDLHLVSQCDLLQYFFGLRKDYKKNMAAAYMIELVDMIMQPEQTNHEVYQLMMDALNTLDKSEDINKVVHLFQIKILQLSGFSPHLDSCVRCGKKIKGRARFSLKDGGLLCLNCPSPETNFNLISSGAVATILHAEKNAWRNCLKLGLTPTVRAELKYTLNNFLVFNLERQIKSSKFLP